MNDREMLIYIQDEIGAYLVNNPETPAPNGDLVIQFRDIDPRDVPKGHFEGCVWPMPIYGDEKPVISDGFNLDPDKGRIHKGDDIMYKNAHEMVPDPPDVTKWYHCPSKIIPTYAACAGHLWSCQLLDNGWAVRIDNHDWYGFPLNTLYLHMDSVNVPEWDGANGMYLPAGYQIGIVGDGSAGGESTEVTHCHFEMHDYSSGSGVAIDPEPFLTVFNYGMIAA